MWCYKWKRLSPHETSVKAGSQHAVRISVNAIFDMLMGLLLYAGSPTAELTQLRIIRKALNIEVIFGGCKSTHRRANGPHAITGAGVPISGLTTDSLILANSFSIALSFKETSVTTS